MESGGVTYASTAVLTRNETEDVPLIGGCKFISGANLCINLKCPQNSLPFFNPPGARGGHIPFNHAAGTIGPQNTVLYVS